jgi:hypothetical protein
MFDVSKNLLNLKYSYSKLQTWLTTNQVQNLTFYSPVITLHTTCCNSHKIYIFPYGVYKCRVTLKGKR